MRAVGEASAGRDPLVENVVQDMCPGTSTKRPRRDVIQRFLYPENWVRWGWEGKIMVIITGTRALDSDSASRA